MTLFAEDDILSIEIESYHEPLSMLDYTDLAESRKMK